MSIEIIQKKLLSYQPQTILEQENALKEIAQEIALMSLSRNDFFQIAAFQGGTCLRILYGLNRFSEDLDFVLEEESPSFSWGPYLAHMVEEFKTYGYSLEMIHKEKLNKTVRSAFLKTQSTGGLLVIKEMKTTQAILTIKLEIDTNPPTGSTYELQYLDFPMPYSVKTQQLPSLFASKIHALLCRPYIKGRDWYDLVWYIARNTSVNSSLLESALKQSGPWKNSSIAVTTPWLIHELKTKIDSIDWEEAKKDVAKFLKPQELSTLTLWSKDFFRSRINKLNQYLNER